jgi:hypothetical protein
VKKKNKWNKENIQQMERNNFVEKLCSGVYILFSSLSPLPPRIFKMEIRPSNFEIHGRL